MDKKEWIGLVFLLLFGGIACSSQNLEKTWSEVVRSFVEDYQKLDIEGLHIDYYRNLQGIRGAASLAKQEQVFTRLEQELDRFDPSLLTPEEQIDYALLSYQLELNQERIALEIEWRSEVRPVIDSEAGFSTVPNGKAWYAYYLKRWLDKDVHPDKLYAFGLNEIAKVKSRIQAVQVKSGYNKDKFPEEIEKERFYFYDQSSVQAAFEATHERLMPKLSAFFPGVEDIPRLKIDEGTDVRLAQVPAFYRNNTFYYNFFDKPFNKRQIVWIYIHEALPGHHYEINYSYKLDQSPVQRLFNNPGYSEGWAAYIEEIGYEIGAYRDIYDELGKWEWDLIRSVRVALDVGLNYYNWSDDKALGFWRKHIQDKDDIGLREIARMKRWPCQVISYKYGADKILTWRKQFESHSNFNLLDFHTKLLANGPLPFSILEELLLKDLEQG